MMSACWREYSTFISWVWLKMVKSFLRVSCHFVIAASCRDLSIKWLMMSVLASVKCWTHYCWYRILSALDLRVGPRKIQKYYFLSIGPREHPEWCGATHSDTRAPKVPFSAKLTKMPLVNPGLIECQTKSKSPQNSTFHSFTSNPCFSEIFGKFDLELTLDDP